MACAGWEMTLDFTDSRLVRKSALQISCRYPLKAYVQHTTPTLTSPPRPNPLPKPTNPTPQPARRNPSRPLDNPPLPPNALNNLLPPRLHNHAPNNHLPEGRVHRLKIEDQVELADVFEEPVE